MAYSPKEIRLRVRVSRPAVLMATETYWPDWQVTLDGATQKLVRVDEVFHGLALPAGIHGVRMFIVPKQMYMGAAVSGLGLLLTGFCLLWPGARRGVSL